MALEQNFITLNGDRIAYYTAGNPKNPACLFIHGWSSYHGIWHNTIKAMSDDYFCVTLDLLGFGESDKPRDGDYSIIMQGKRLLSIADTLDIAEFCLIGHSMGGQIALCIASMLAPQRVIKLIDIAGVVAASGAPPIERVYPLGRINYYIPVAMPLLRWVSQVEWLAERLYSLLFYDHSVLPFDYWAEDRRMMFQHGAYVSIYKASTAIHELDLTDHLSQVVAPTLVIFGDNDRVVSLEDGYLAYERIPQVNLTLFNQCGHFPMYERAPSYLRTLRKFLHDDPITQDNYGTRNIV